MFQTEIHHLEAKGPLDALVAAADLTRDESDVMLLLCKQALPLEAVASQMRMPIDRVERLLKRALEQLKQVTLQPEPEVLPKRVRKAEIKITPVVPQQQTREERRRQEQIERHLRQLTKGDNVCQWFHVQLRAVGLHQLLNWCSADLSDEQIVVLSGLYAKGFSFEQLRLLLLLPSREEVKAMAQEAMQIVWQKYPEKAMQVIHVS